MQDTRQKILEFIQTHNDATVDELRSHLGGITAVTVRHHLDVLRREGLVEAPQVRRRDTPGRPRYVYTLTPEAAQHFPKNFRSLTDNLLDELNERLSPDEVATILRGVARRMAAEANTPSGVNLLERLALASAFLTNKGYVAGYEAIDGGYSLETCNCPYDLRPDGNNTQLCRMDLALIEELVGVKAEQTTCIAGGHSSCGYFFSADVAQ